MTVSLEENIKQFAKSVGCWDVVNELDQVILDGLSMPETGSADYLKKLTALDSLSMNHCSLSKLPVFPKGLPLRCLELTDNKLSGNDLTSLANLTELAELHLSGNQIETAEDLKPLQALENLVILDQKSN